MSTRSTLRSLLERRMGEENPITSGNLTDMSATTTLQETGRAEANEYWDNCYIYLSTAVGTAAPHDEERQISAYYSASTISVLPGFTSSAGDTYAYEMRRMASRQNYNDAVNEAIRRARDAFLEEVVDESSVIIYADQREYTAPSGCKYIYRLDLEQADTPASGTATATSATTLTDDTKSWTADEFNDNYAVVITDGTGQGQQRTITDTTTDTLTVATWTTTPDTTSEYIVKYCAQEELSWFPVTEYEHHTTTSSGAETMQIHFYRQLTEGMAVRIVYAAEPAELTADSSNTGVPDAYIENEGQAALYEMMASKVTPSQSDSLLERASYYRGLAEQLKRVRGYRIPSSRLAGDKSASSPMPSDYPF